jgi:hypothetical protein
MEKYLKLIYEEVYAADGLCVMAKGIGLEKLFVKFVASYSNTNHFASSASASPDPTTTSTVRTTRGVVFCLNAVDEEKWIQDQLYAEGVQQIDFPKVTPHCVLPDLTAPHSDSGWRCVRPRSQCAISARRVFHRLLQGDHPRSPERDCAAREDQRVPRLQCTQALRLIHRIFHLKSLQKRKSQRFH